MLTVRGSATGALAALAVAASAVALAAPGAATPRDTVGGPELASHGVVVHLGPGAHPLPTIDADTWVLADLTTGEVLAAKDAHKQVLPASTLKTLTAVSLMPRLDRTEVVTATAREAGQIGSRVGLVPGATYTVWDLWNALLLPSANDAAMALADAYGGRTQTVALMQAEARRLGALDTTPKTPSGLDTPGQFTSAYDMALIARAALQIPDFRTVTMTTYYQFPGRMPAAGHKRGSYQIYTENRLLRHHYRGVAGGKTGFTSLAHRTFWGAAERGGHLLVVTLFQIHEPTETAARKLLDWGFASLGRVTPVGTLVAPASADDPGAAAPAQPGSTPAPTTVAAAAGIVGAAASPSHRGWLVVGLLLVAAMAALLGWLTWRRRGLGPDPVLPVAPASPVPAASPALDVLPGGPGPTVAVAAAPPVTPPLTPTAAPVGEAPVAEAPPVAAPPAAAPHDDTAPVPIVPSGGHVRVVRPPSRPGD